MKIPNIKNIEIAGVDMTDFPDFSDAYIAYAEFIDSGVPLTDAELDSITNRHPDVVNALAHDSTH